MTVAYNEEELIRGCLYGLKDLKNYVVISKPWQGVHIEFDKTEQFAKEMGAEVIRKDFKTEGEQRDFVMEFAEKERFDFVFIIDVDEYYFREDIQKMIKFVSEHSDTERFNINKCIYFWKDENWEILPRCERTIPVCYKSSLRFGRGNRNIISIKILILPEDITLYHFSYAGSEERMRNKLEHFSHAAEMKQDWLENVYKKMDRKNGKLAPIIS